MPLKTYTYHNEYRTLIAHFISAFDEIVIKRFDSDNVVTDTIQPAFVYAPKHRILHDLAQKTSAYSVPVVSVWITATNRAPNRITNKTSATIHDSVANPHLNKFDSVKQPLAVDITLSLSIVAKYQRDIEQILTGIIAYCDPYIMISWSHPVTRQEIRSKIVWSGSVSHDYPVEIDEKSPYRLTADTSFTIEGWVFRGDNRTVGKIDRINTTYTPITYIPCLYDDLVSMQLENTDEFSILGRPFVRGASYTTIATSTATSVLTLYGQMFKNVTGVYLSACPTVSAIGLSPSSFTLWDVASADTLQTSAVSAFTAYPLSSFVLEQETRDFWGDIKYLDYPHFSKDFVFSDNAGTPLKIPFNKITVNIPALAGSGTVDIIVTNDAGGGLLSQDCKLSTVNPHPSGHPLHESWVATNPDWADVGLLVT